MSRALGSPAQLRGYVALASRVLTRSGTFRPLLPGMFTGLNALGAVPWRINEPVLRVQEAVWAMGGGMGEIPKRTDVALPEEPGPEAGADASPSLGTTPPGRRRGPARLTRVPCARTCRRGREEGVLPLPAPRPHAEQ